MSISVGKIIELTKIVDPRGNLTVAEGSKDMPFDIKRTYWIYDIPGGENRGGHAHKHCLELIIAVAGSFNVTLDNGKERRSYLLNHPYPGAVCLVLASDPFCEEDYIREYDDFLTYIRNTANVRHQKI